MSLSTMSHPSRPICPISIKLLGQQDWVMRRRTIHFYKVQWSRHSEEEATWETEDLLRSNYLDFLPLQ
jgi:hypothetical protein